MMSLWIGIVGLTLAAVLFGLWPLLQRRAGRSALDHAIAFYHARQDELARQHAAGAISDGDRAAAEAEQARALIAISRLKAKEGAEGFARETVRRKIAAMAFLAGVPVLATGIYLVVGNPALPDRPLASRVQEPKTLDVADALRRIEAHLAQNPDDGRGHEVVAPVYLRTGRFTDAANAYRKVIAILGESPDRLAALGEALVAQENGVIPAEARISFERAVAIDREFEKARFYLALALEQDGKPAEAYAQLVAMVNGMPEGPGRMRILDEIERFRAEGKAPPTGPSSEPGRAIAALPDTERDQVIRGMVEGLAARLGAEGGPVADWERLIQARMVLGQRELAFEHLAAARKAFAADQEASARLATMAARLDHFTHPERTPALRAAP